MKKLALVLAIAMIAAFSMPAFAEHQEPGLEIGGSFRLTASSYDPGYKGGADADWFQQRIRIPWTWQVNDNVKAFMRTDWTEYDYWGEANNKTATTANTTDHENDELAIDYGWVEITQPMWTFTAGIITTGFGHFTGYESYHEGLQLDLKFAPVTVTLSYGKLAENGSTVDNAATDDDDIYGAQVAYATDMFTVGAYAGKNDSDDDNTYMTVIGLYATANFNGATIKAAFDSFSGDALNNVDYDGEQLWVEVSMPFSDALTLGAEFLWASGADDGDQQITNIANDLSHQVFDYDGAMGIDEGMWYGSMTYFELATDDGVLGFVGKASFAATDALTLYFKAGYFEPEENDNLNSMTLIVGSFDYAWMPNVTLSTGIGYVKPDYENSATNDDAEVDITVRLGVAF